MLSHLQHRELFHLAFLRQLAGRLKPNTYAVKGGVNLRFFFGSPRYSEDLDIDIKDIELFRLKDIVLDILTSKTLLAMLRTFQIDKIITPDIAKASETTQRFKVHLVTTASEDLFTKIEFSRRKSEPSVKTEPISEALLQIYKLPPILVSHYLIDAVVSQKISALANRAEPQARDVFDLYALLPRIDEARTIPKKIPKTTLKKAYDHVFDLNFAVFKNTVLNYLSDEDRVPYDSKEVWEDMQIKVGEIILSCGQDKHHTGRS